MAGSNGTEIRQNPQEAAIRWANKQRYRQMMQQHAPLAFDDYNNRAAAEAAEAKEN